MNDVCDGSVGWPGGQAVGKGGDGAIVILTFFVVRARAWSPFEAQVHLG